MTDAKFIKIGFGNLVSINRIVAVVGPESSPVKRLIQDARDRDMLIDATSGRKTRSVLIMDSEHIILASITVEELDETMREEGQS